MVVTILIHELGHMAGGLASGYNFISLTFLGLKLTKTRRHYRLSRERSLGNCQMYSERITANPSFLILGGCLANILFAACTMLLSAVLILIKTSGVWILLFLILSGLNFSAGMNNLFGGSRYSDGAAYREIRASKRNAYRYNLLMLLENGMDIEEHSHEILTLGLFEDDGEPSSMKEELFEWKRSNM